MNRRPATIANVGTSCNRRTKTPVNPHVTGASSPAMSAVDSRCCREGCGLGTRSTRAVFLQTLSRRQA